MVRVRPHFRSGIRVKGHHRSAPTRTGGTSGGVDNSVVGLLVAAVLVVAGGGLGAAASSDASTATTFTHTRLDRSEGGSCAESSYGQVHDYLATHPCARLTRALYDASDGTGTARVAVAWVTMPDTVRAAEFKVLVDRHGTGNITELTKDGIRFSGYHYDSLADGTTVVIAQAEQAPGSTLSTNRLKAAATEAITLTP